MEQAREPQEFLCNFIGTWYDITCIESLEIMGYKDSHVLRRRLIWYNADDYSSDVLRFL
jgi:hypothetical protein